VVKKSDLNGAFPNVKTTQIGQKNIHDNNWWSIICLILSQNPTTGFNWTVYLVVISQKITNGNTSQKS
jgi:hypothetical protein